ncbi:MAG: carboxypeptidase-like regulatory domain-containing protein, partial [Bacteroidota bacterium]
MWAKSFLFLLFVVNVMVVFSQKTVKIYGVVSDAKTGERLQAATIKNNTDLSTSTISNFYGYYLLIVPSSTNVNIEVSFVGYQTQFFYLNLKKDTLLDIN